MKGELHPAIVRSTCGADFRTSCLLSCLSGELRFFFLVWFEGVGSGLGGLRRGAAGAKLRATGGEEGLPFGLGVGKRPGDGGHLLALSGWGFPNTFA